MKTINDLARISTASFSPFRKYYTTTNNLNRKFVGKDFECYSIEDFKEKRQQLEGSVAFVPTMGCLHEGHLSLVQQAKKKYKNVVTSVYVNPLQFAAHEDLDAYPRPLQDDISKFNKEGVDLVFIPNSEMIYFGEVGGGTEVDVKGVSHQREGAIRPHFFKGVATVVLKLLNIVQPDALFLGQKDAQQAIVVRKMLKDLFVDTKLEIGPTVREPSGLAMSSRNEYLTEKERLEIAPIFYQGLKKAINAYQCENINDVDTLTKIAKDYIQQQSNGLLHIQYCDIDDFFTLEQIRKIDSKKPALLTAAVGIGELRLIDNVIFNSIDE